MKPLKRLPPLSAQDIQRFWSKVQIGATDECWPIRRPTNHPYGDFSWNGLTHIPAHRVAYFLHHGVDPSEQLVCHSCDNPPCCNPAHLFLGDYMANKQDCVAKGRHYHVLNTEQVTSIKRMLADGVTFRAIAETLGIKRHHVQSIKKEVCWTSVAPQYVPARNWGHDRSGERNGRATLTAAQVIAIRERIESGATNIAIATEFDTGEQAISKIRTRRTWKHLI